MFPGVTGQGIYLKQPNKRFAQIPTREDLDEIAALVTLARNDNPE